MEARYYATFCTCHMLYFLLGRNSLLSVLFSDTQNVFSALNKRSQFSIPHKTTYMYGGVVFSAAVSYILIFTF
jgi:hypothetical protein